MSSGSALITDLHQLTMAAGYFKHGLHEKRVSFELFVRRLPRHRRYLLAAGLETALGFLARLRFSEAQLEYLADVPALRSAMSFPFVEYLRGFRFRGDVRAVAEGTVVFAEEPLLRVTGTLLEASLVETFLLSAINAETAVASKAARIVRAAGGAEVLELGTRRTSPEEAVTAARAAFLAGFSATSNVEAGYRWDLPLAGNAAHSWTMSHADELEAFAHYVDAFPRHATLLVDTYDTLEGTRRAIQAAGQRLRGVRLDSGDLLELSRAVRGLLDEAGLTGTRIIASGDLDEHKILALRSVGAPIDVFAVGTQLVRPSDDPSLGGVYKLVYDHTEDRSVAKLSEGKVSLPGLHQVFRLFRDGKAERDVVGMQPEWHLDSEPLLVDWMREGRMVCPLPSLPEIRAHARRQLDALPDALHALEPHDGTPPYEVQLSDALTALLGEVRKRELHG
jgi:nicotinate phosphoribosyltransferase